MRVASAILGCRAHVVLVAVLMHPASVHWWQPGNQAAPPATLSEAEVLRSLQQAPTPEAEVPEPKPAKP